MSDYYKINQLSFEYVHVAGFKPIKQHEHKVNALNNLNIQLLSGT